MLHGDDPCLLPDGTDAYAHAKKLGRFKMVGGCGSCCGAVTLLPVHLQVCCARLLPWAARCLHVLVDWAASKLWTLTFTPAVHHSTALQIKRTEGVSTTDIVGRMLMCRCHFVLIIRV